MPHRLLVVGASAGGVEALQKLVRALPRDLDAAVLIVLHLPPAGRSALAEILRRVTDLPVETATDGEVIARGTIRVTPADQHLLVNSTRMRLFHGPRENGHRPAVDPLFRSAARTWGPRTIGLVLSGALDDGTAGLQAIKSAGGTTLVQSLDEAAYVGMPSSALLHVAVDHVGTVAELAEQIILYCQRAPEESTMSDAPERERLPEDQPDPVLTADGDVHAERELGPSSPYSCPHCHGVLWEDQRGSLAHYRCRVGHAYSQDSLLAAQSDTAEGALWAAYRALEENASTARRLEGRAIEHGHDHAAQRYRQRAEDALTNARMIRSLLARNIGADDDGQRGGGP